MMLNIIINNIDQYLQYYVNKFNSPWVSLEDLVKVASLASALGMTTMNMSNLHCFAIIKRLDTNR